MALAPNRSTFAALEHRTERIRKPAIVDSLFFKSPLEPEWLAWEDRI